MPPGHDMTLAALGGVILWFGWYGFNPGSTLSAMDFDGIGRVATNTTLAACAGGLVAMFFVYPRSHKWDTGITINGFLAGLVAITCPCYWVSPFGAICIGAIAGVVMVLGVDFIEWLRVDDPIGAVAVHGVCGIWGTLSLGLVRHRPVRPARADRRRHVDAGRGPVLRRRLRSSSVSRSSAARSSRSSTFAVALRRDVRRQGARCAAGLRRGRARGPRHPRARCAGVPPRVRLHGLLADPVREVGRRRRCPRVQAPRPISVGRMRRAITCISSPQSSSRIALEDVTDGAEGHRRQRA